MPKPTKKSKTEKKQASFLAAVTEAVVGEINCIHNVTIRGREWSVLGETNGDGLDIILDLTGPDGSIKRMMRGTIHFHEEEV